MRLNDLTADEFARSMALIGQAVENIAAGELGKQFKADVSEFRNGADRSDEAAGDWAVGMLLKYVQKVLEGNVEDAYRILAALDGQTLAEYKAAFTPKKLMADIAAARQAFSDGEFKGLLEPFFG